MYVIALYMYVLACIIVREVLSGFLSRERWKFVFAGVVLKPHGHSEVANVLFSFILIIQCMYVYL